MAEQKKGAFIFASWVEILDSLSPKDYKAVFSCITRYIISGEDVSGTLSGTQKALVSMMINEQRLTDQAYAAKKERQDRWREKKKAGEGSAENHGDVTENHGDVSETSQRCLKYGIKNKEQGIKNKESTLSESGIGAAPAAPPPAIDAEEKKKLVADGIPAAYVEYFCDVCEAKGYHYDNPTSACKAWWKKDKSRPEWQQPSGQSFDTNEFFDAALRKSIGDNENT